MCVCVCMCVCCVCVCCVCVCVCVCVCTHAHVYVCINTYTTFYSTIPDPLSLCVFPHPVPMQACPCMVPSLISWGTTQFDHLFESKWPKCLSIPMNKWYTKLFTVTGSHMTEASGTYSHYFCRHYGCQGFPWLGYRQFQFTPHSDLPP